MLQALTATVGPIRPSLGRQIRVAPVMDEAEMTFDDLALRRVFPNLPRTPVTPDPE